MGYDISDVVFTCAMTGVCLGMQCAVIEFARNVLGLVDANSTEFQQDTSHPLVGSRLFVIVFTCEILLTF